MNNCAECEALCRWCQKFQRGDRIELNIIGVLTLGSRMVGRGTVVGKAKVRGLALVLVNWDGYPIAMVARVSPKYLQKLSADGEFL